MTDTVFWICVGVLKWIAASTGTTYEEANVYIFVYGWPVLTIMMFVYIIYLRRQVKYGRD